MIRWDPTDDVEVILGAIRELESGGRYTVRSSTSSASGAYQYITSTWNHFGGYPEAYLAPPVVQDAKARADVVRFLSMFGGDVSMVPIMWYYPRAAGDASWMDRVPHPEGNSLTVRQYQQRWLRVLQRLQAELEIDADDADDGDDAGVAPEGMGGGLDAAAVTVLSDLPQRTESAATFDPTTSDTSTAGDARSRPGTGRDGGGGSGPADDDDSDRDPARDRPGRDRRGGDRAADNRAADDRDEPFVVDDVTVSEETVDWAVRSVPPLSGDLPPHGPGSQRSIVFPVLGPVTYADGWGDCRDGCARRHEGTDIIGVRMQPLLAAADGTIHTLRYESRGTAGVILSIIDDDGWRYNYFHNNNDTPGTDDGQALPEWRYPPGLKEGDRVTAGQIIGYMGDSGNSEGSVPHLHFEFRDPSGAARPSYWSLKAAEARQACTVGLGPWSFPHEPGAETDDEVGEDDVDGDDADANDADANDAGGEADGSPDAGDAVVGRPTTLAELIVQQEASVERGVEMTSVTPLFGDGQWLIDTEGRVTATGDAALIIPSRAMECEPGPITPHGADAAGWDTEPDTSILQGTVLEEADLTGTELAVLPQHAVDDAGDLVADAADEGSEPGARTAAPGRAGGDARPSGDPGEHHDDQPAGQPGDTPRGERRDDRRDELAAYKDPSTAEAIIVVDR